MVSTDERFAELWTDYLEGLCDEAQLAELRDLLAHDDQLLRQAADLYQTHRLLGLVGQEGPHRLDEFIKITLSKLPDDTNAFVQGVMHDVQQFEAASAITPEKPIGQNKATSATRPLGRRRWVGLLAGLAMMLLLAIVARLFWPGWPLGTGELANGPSVSSPTDGVRFVSLAQATFFGELVPAVGSAVTPDRDYVLKTGLVELRFPAGASAIVEGPAVFRVLSDDSLGLDVGKCSVHAPAGAEGFRVETPVTRVVDRGTRFAVSVSETSETDVQVIEGAADVYERADEGSSSKSAGTAKTGRQPERAQKLRLTPGQAKRFVKKRAFAADAIPFDPTVYRAGLPDRVIRYEASTSDEGGYENLQSVTLQRAGQVQKVPVEKLIKARVTWFRSNVRRGAFVCGEPTLPSRRAQTSRDDSLVTGVINPGGSKEPLMDDPVMTGRAGTPGLAVRFDEPVVNGPGPDVVFFDLQTLTHSATGDPFHVSPLRFGPGLKSHTIKVYDLTLESPHALPLKRFYVHMFAGPAHSLADLETIECLPRLSAMKFRGVVVGIDLSDLGYAPGDRVEGLFFQDALDDKNYVDPVFIGGLPTID